MSFSDDDDVEEDDDEHDTPFMHALTAIMTAFARARSSMEGSVDVYQEVFKQLKNIINHIYIYINDI